MESWIKDLQYIVMPTRGPVKGYEKEYYATYDVWRSAWEKFRSEIGINAPLNSDGFVIADEVGAVFYKGECVGFAAFSYGSLKQGPLAHQSWFNSWDTETMKALAEISDNAVICSQFTVNPKFAGKGHIVMWKEIVALCGWIRFDLSDADVMAGHLNLTRGMGKLAGEALGGTVLCENHAFNFYGVDVPAMLVAYERSGFEKLKNARGIHQLCDDLWTRLVHLSEHPVHQKVLPFRKVA